MAVNRGKSMSEAEFRRMWNDPSISMEEMGRRLGISGNAVKGRARTRGFDARPTGFAWQRKHSSAAMIRLYRLGVSEMEIARTLGCARGTVQTALNKAGVDRRPKSLHAPAKIGDVLQVMLAQKMAQEVRA